jgi:hypothetical protein
MATVTPEVLAVAETLNLCLPPAPDEQRFLGPRFAAFVSVRSDPHHNVVQRIRVAPDEVPALVEEVRALFRSHGRTAITWEAGPSTTPPDLAERLLAFGMVPDSEPEVAGMVLAQPPVETAPGVTVARVTSLDDFGAHTRIIHRCFMPDQPEPTDAEIAADWERRRGREDHLRRYLALVGGEPIAAADAVLVEGAITLCGGATLPAARGKGAYRALVEARWQDAVARGTPVLVVQAGSMSRPILARLGFEEVARMRVMLDRFG